MSLLIHEENQPDSLLEECAARGPALLPPEPAGPILRGISLEDKVFVEHMASPSDKVVSNYKPES